MAKYFMKTKLLVRISQSQTVNNLGKLVQTNKLGVRSHPLPENFGAAMANMMSCRSDVFPVEHPQFR